MRSRISYGPGGKRTFYLDDREVTEAEYNAATPQKLDEVLRDTSAVRNLPAGHQPSCWPMVSNALSVHPKQVDEANNRAKRHGINVLYKRNGQVVIPDRNERRKLLSLERMHDRLGGYGD